MRVLLIHNYYQSSAPSGEDAVFRTERALLESAGHEVETYERRNDEITASAVARVRTAVDGLWSRRSFRELREVIRRFRPDVAHFHNTFPLVTPSAYRACREAGVPVVQTLHNYRLLCPNGLLLRQGRPCEMCVGGNLWPAIKHACYRGSTAATAAAAASLALHHRLGTYSADVDRYIALTEFARERFIRGGLPADRIVVRPNCLDVVPDPKAEPGTYALYVGRLTHEKGIEPLLQAWSSGIQVQLKIAGDGALRATLEREHSGELVQFLGMQSKAAVYDLMRGAAMLIVPSVCYEGFPLTVLEAMACGLPLAVSSIGALDEIVQEPRHGVKFAAGDSASLRAAVLRLLAMDLPRIGASNRAEFLQRYSRDRALQSLESIYASVIPERSSRALALA